jgi:prepilin-type processing-associated H-X9-DG protein
MQLYLPDFGEQFFWTSTNVNTEGMEWYVWAGRTNNNLSSQQENIFNRIDRPLNHYGLNEKVVICPLDQGRLDTLDHTVFDWVGNSYMFNAIGYPTVAGGLDGVKSSAVQSPGRTVLFADSVVIVPQNPKGWHRKAPAGNVMLVDGHVEFHTALTVTNLVW